MKVVLPDNSELELPDGATGLDAARAIGPKLAEQAVLVRSNGNVQDLRAPLEDGQPIQILTTRDKDDPDALYVLRHSTAHLLAEAVRRLYPGTKIAIGPPIENGFYYDFDFPEPIGEEALERIEEEMRKELAEGRSWNREEVEAEEAKRYFAEQGEEYKVELVDTAEGPITMYTQGDFRDLCRGPHLQDSKPIKAVKLTGLAGAYWRGNEHNKQLTRIYGTAFYDQADLDAYLENLEQARARDHRRLGAQLDLFHLSDHAPGMPFWHPKGMVIWNALEDLRRRENARRGYVEVKTPLMYDVETWKTSGHWEKFKDEMFLVPYGEDRTLGLKPMNCPGHMLLFGSTLRSYRDLPLRYAEASTLHRNERAGTLHGLLRVQHVTQDDAHLFVTPEQIEDEIFAALDFAAYLYELFGARGALRALDAAGQQARHRRGVGLHRRRAAGRARPARDPVHDQRGRRRLLRPEDRPAHDRRARPLLADGDDPARLADAGPLRPHLHGRRQRGAHAVRDPPRALRLARALHRDPDRALRRRLPVLARARPDPDPAGRGGPPRRPRTSWRASWPSSASRWTSATRRSASGSATPRSRRSRSRSSTATRSRTSRSRSASAGGEQSTRTLDELRSHLATL